MITDKLVSRASAAALVSSLACAAAPTASASGWQSAASLQAMCNAPDVKLQKYCLGYVVAVADVMENSNVLGLHACFKPTTTGENLTAAVNAWIAAHPEYRSNVGFYSVSHALAAAFPCP
jgi:hypothetical protein